MLKTASAIGYIRVSTDEQASEGVSLAAQEERVQAYCTMAGLKLVANLREEGVSAKVELGKRPEGGKLQRTLKRLGATHVVALKLDRLFRNTIDALQTVKKWETAGISMHIIDMGGQAISTNSAIGKLFLTMLAGFAEFERGLISERTRAAMAHKKAHNEFLGNVPYGYTIDGKNLVVDLDEMQIIRYIYSLRQQGKTLQAIADTLNEKDVPTKISGKWYPSGIRYILRNDSLRKELERMQL